MERTSVGVGSVGIVLCVLVGGCSWDEFKERSRMAVVGASDAVVHAPPSSRSYQITINGHPFYCHDNGVTTNCQEL